MMLVAALAAPVWAWPTGAQERLRSMDQGPPPPSLEAPKDRAGTPATAVVERMDDAARARAQALAAMERLRGELQTLAAIRDAQTALLAWNRERARTGAPPAALSAVPCRDPALEVWCPLLPATFGRTSGRNGR